VIAAEEISRTSGSVGIACIAHANLHVNQMLSATPQRLADHANGCTTGQDRPTAGRRYFGLYTLLRVVSSWSPR
jgi:hypothetical protein